MRNLILTAMALTAMLIGGSIWTETAQARPRRWYRAPVVRYDRPYYGYRTYVRPYNRYYGYPTYYRPYYYGPYYGGGLYFRW